MTTTKRYDFRVLQKGELWSAEVIRRASSEKVVVSTSKDGFATETEAQTWAVAEIALLLKKYKEKDRARSEKRKQVKMEQALIEKDRGEERPLREKSKWDLIKKATKESDASR